MKSILSKPYKWFFAAIPVFYFSVLLYETNSALDIQLHDTFYVISKEIFYLIPCAYFFIWGGLHLAVRSYFKHQPHQIASLVHFVITFGSVWLMVIWSFYNQSHPLTTPFTNHHSYMIQSGMYVFLAIFLVFVLTQFVFFLYLMVLLARSLRK